MGGEWSLAITERNLSLYRVLLGALDALARTFPITWRGTEATNPHLLDIPSLNSGFQCLSKLVLMTTTMIVIKGLVILLTTTVETALTTYMAMLSLKCI